MKSAGVGIPINGTRSNALRSEQGIPVVVSPSISPSPHVSRLTFSMRVRGPAISSGPVALARPEQCPYDPGHAVGQCDCDQLHGFSLEHPPEPISAGLLAAPRADARHRPEIEQPAEIPVRPHPDQSSAARTPPPFPCFPRAASWPRIGAPPDRGHGADDQKAADVALAHLRGSSQHLLAAARLLPRHEPEPGGEVAPAPELLHRRGESINRHGGDRADAQHGPQPRRRRPGGRLCADALLQPGDLLGAVRDLVEIEPGDLPHRCRWFRALIVKRRLQHLQMRRPPRRDDTYSAR